MYTQPKKETRKIHHFLDALKALQGKEASYFKNDLEVVGVYLDSPYTERMPAHPQFNIEFVRGSDTQFHLTILLKPTEEQSEDLKLYQTYLKYTGAGEVLEPNHTPTPTTSENMMDIFLHQGSFSSPVQDYELTLQFIGEKVSLRKFKLNGVQYYQYGLDYVTQLDDKEQAQTVYILLKDKESSAENFFSTLVGETLTKRDLDIILYSIANQNITGLFVGGAIFTTKDVQATVYATREVRVDYEENTLFIQSQESILEANLADVKETVLSREGQGRYTLRARTGKGEFLTLFIG